MWYQTSLVLLSVAVLPAHSPAQTTPTIKTEGRGEVRLPPDLAVVRLGVAARASTAAAAAAEAGRRLDAVTDTLRRMGLAPEVAVPLALEVTTNEARAEGRLVDYEAGAGVVVRVRNLARLGAVVDG